MAVLERPGVEVIQQFVAAAPTVVLPTLAPVIIGEACQIEEQETAGLFDNVSTIYSYPLLKAGANVVEAEVKVELITQGASGDTFDITNDSVVVIAATTVTVGKDPTPTKTLVTNRQNSPKAGRTIEDLLADYFTSGLRVADVVIFEDTASGLVSNTSVQSNNLGDWIITDVLSKTKTDVLGKTPAKLVGTVEENFEITASTNDLLIVDIDGLGDISIILSPGSSLTAQNIVDDLNADSIFSARGIADVFKRKVRIRSRTLGAASSVTIGFVSPDAHATLGFTDGQTDTGSDQASMIAETDVEYRVIRRGATTGTISISYRACRTDEAAEFFTFQDVETLKTTLGKIDPDNPLAFGIAAALAATDLAVHGVIVADKDSVTSHQLALDFLGSKEVYSLVPLSQNAAVLDLYPTHVDLFSESANKKERIAFLCPLITQFEAFQTSRTATAPVGTPPTSRFSDSGAKFSTNGVPVGAVLRVTAIGVGKTLVIDSSDKTSELASKGFFEIQIASIINETDVDIVGQFTADPGDVTYSVKSKDFTQPQKALNQSGAAAGENNRRIRHVFPDQGKFSVDGVITTLPNYFDGCALAGMTSGLSPSQGFTNLPVPGAVELIGSNDVMSELDLNILAGGGVFILVQDVVNGPITVRHQLTTAVGDIKTREHSIISAIDYSAKTFRDNLKHLVGRFNNTQTFIDQQLRPAAAGVLQDLKEEVVVGLGTRIISIERVSGKLDEVEIAIEYEALVPVNKIIVRFLI